MSRPLTDPGRLVAGRYRLQSQIGGGGMGAVWLARDELLGRQVAVKQVLVSATDETLAEQQRQRALREGRIAARLSHPHAISVYDVAQEGGTPWLVMEYLPSRSLAEVVTADGLLRVDQVAQIGAQVADALAATHAAGIVHRDVKPANVLIGRGERIEGLVKITDFGISHAHGDVTLTQTGQITGTPAFLAPEVAQGAEMGEASDVFSLGATLYTCLEGQPPFGMEENALAMLHKVAGGAVVPPQRAGSLTAPLMRMLSADPADRPTMVQVRDELAKLAAGRSGDTTTVLLARTDLRSPSNTAVLPADPPPRAAAPVPPVAAAAPSPAPPVRPPASTTPPPRVVPAPRRSGRKRGAWLAAALVLVALAALVGFWALGRDDPDGSSAEAEASDAPTSSAPPSTDPPADDTTADQPSDTGTGTGSGPTTPRPTPPPEEVTAPADDPVSAVNAFFALVPGDLAAAHQLTSPSFQAEFPLSRFSGFWDDFTDVRVSNVRAQGDDRATADITYVRPDGTTETESHELRFETGEDGRLLLDRDEAR
ncbi:serine/threonine-protein kinase [Blastococcus sp. SYSU D01042]